MTNGILKAALAVVFLAVAFCAGFALKDLQNGRPPSGDAFKALLNGGKREKATPTEVFKEHYGLIQAKYYRPVDPSHLKYAAMEGMFTSLGDPHTNFLEPKIAESFAMETRGDFVGIGARLEPDPLGAKIIKVYSGSPAQHAGVKEGDLVVAVEGKSVSGLNADEIASKIRGEEGTVVKFTVMRAGAKVNLVARRATVMLPTAEGKMLEGLPIGYISVLQFAETTPAQFDEALQTVLSNKPKGLIIDMRGNPGGLLESATLMLSRFRSDGVVVSMRERGTNVKVQRTPAGRTIQTKIPIAILINEESASAAEIFAGCMQEYGRAVLVGEHSYGKASVQNVFPLVGGASAKVTIARYYLPSGKNISRSVDEEGQYIKGGLTPDVPAELVIKTGTEIGKAGFDSQLDRAIQALGVK